jgi:hypothetical protein
VVGHSTLHDFETTIAAAIVHFSPPQS